MLTSYPTVNEKYEDSSLREKWQKIVDNKKTIFYIVMSPIILYTLNVLAICIFNVGTYLGTFLRNLYTIVVCL